MGFSEGEIVCMKHRNHMQSPGVCSCCLRERLSKLSVPINLVLPSYNQYSSNSNSSTPTKFYYYSSGHSSSSHLSPSTSRKHHRIMSDVFSSLSVVSGRSGGDGLKKSRSIAFVAARGGGGGKDVVVNSGNSNKQTKGGFWSKLIKSTSKRTKEAFVHHPRIKERSVY